MPSTMFDPHNYGAISGSGAAKLADSQVAPLVAAARGYQTVNDDPDEIREALRTLKLGDPRGSSAMTLKAAVSGGDALVIPLMAFDEAASKAHSGDFARRSTYQFRPSEAVIIDGAPRKYLFFKGAAIPIDAHPALPWDWASKPGRILITEGTIKADSVLTAILVHHGIPTDELNNTDDAPTRLRSILDGFAPLDRVLVLSVAGVANWHNTANEWASIPIKERDVLVAFDADSSANPQVWKQMAQLGDLIDRKGGVARYVELPRATIGAKAGIDDFLAGGGTWADVLGRTSSELPERPLSDADGSDWRVDSDGCSVSVREIGDDGRVRWVKVSPYGGRIKTLTTIRALTGIEEANGFISPDAPAREDLVEIEVTWRDEHGDEDSADVVGPADILLALPADWKREGAVVPARLKRRSSWPPRKEGEAWLNAMKEHRQDEVDHATVFRTSNWVPSNNGAVYVVGNQAINEHGVIAGAVVGVGEADLHGITNFGVEPCDQNDREARIADVRKMLRCYQEAFSNPQAAAATLTYAFRAFCPRPPAASLLFYGPSGQGKSWAAAAAIATMQRQPGTWSEDRLPGSAKNSKPASEQAMAMAPVWVFDDLAPSADARRATADEANMSELMRAAHNRTPRLVSTRNRTQGEVFTPRAVTIFTAENSPSIASAVIRAVSVEMSKGTLGTNAGVDAFVAMRDRTGEAGRVAYSVILEVARHINSPTGGWKDEMAGWHAQLRTQAYRALGRWNRQGAAQRSAKIVADASLGLIVLGDYISALDAGTGELEEELASLHAMHDDLFDLVGRNLHAGQTRKPGVALLQALRNALGGGRAHLADATRGGAPFTGDGDSKLRNTMVGWEVDDEGGARPRGVNIGHLIERDGVTYALFDRDRAFTEAARYSPELIPHGSKAQSSWLDAWSLGVASGPWRRRIGAGGIEEVTCQIQVAGTKFSAVPVPVSLLLSDDDLPDAAATETAAEPGDILDDIAPDIDFDDVEG